MAFETPYITDRRGTGDNCGDAVAALGTHSRYRPDVVSLACGRVAEARQRAGLSVEAFSAVLGQLLGWPPRPDLIRAWESGVPPPGQVVIACEVIGSRIVETGPGGSSDEVASAAREAEAVQPSPGITATYAGRYDSTAGRAVGPCARSASPSFIA
jgi:hypothetical protein